MSSVARSEEFLLKRKMAMEMFELGFTPKEIRKKLGMSSSWVYKYCRSGRVEINWSQDEVQKLSELHAKGFSWDLIAAKLDRTQMSCRVKFCRELKKTRNSKEVVGVLRMLEWARKKTGITRASTLMNACRRADIYGRYFKEET